MSDAFLDTSFALALEYGRDQSHVAARREWQAFLAAGRNAITTSFVVTELVTHLNSRGYHAQAVAAGERLMGSDRIELIAVDRDLWAAGWDYFRRHGDKRYSLTDCISFVVMERRGLTDALTFDAYFEQAGFVRLPE